MHILFVHKSFPAQFGPLLRHLAKSADFQCSFVSELPAAQIGGVRRIQYRVAGGATEQTHPCSRTFENAVWHAHAVHAAVKAHPEIQPDLIVGHSGFGSTLYLAELFDCPIINHFEFYYRTRGSDLDFRPDFPPSEMAILRARTRNAMLLLDLQACSAGYCPTDWQRSLFPPEYQPKLETIFDGIGCDFWRRRPDVPRQVGGREIPCGTRLVTYVARGLEAIRGFDIFMKVAGRICAARGDVMFAVVGGDRVCYGGDLEHIAESSFREHVLVNDRYDLSRFIFTGQIPSAQLVELLSLSDLHVYLTAPFVLSWSCLNALACGCTVLASDTAPVREVIEHERNGLLAGFFDLDALTREALRVLADPTAFRPLGEAAVERIHERYDVRRTIPKMLALFDRVTR